VAAFVGNVGHLPAKKQKPEVLIAEHLDKVVAAMADASLAGAAATEDLAEKVTTAIKECCDGKQSGDPLPAAEPES
jgi:hypothetical protein